MGTQAHTDTRYQIFVEEFFHDCDASAAYLRAGFKTKTPQATWANASRLLRHARVQAMLRRKVVELQARLDLQHDRVLLEDSRLAYSDLRTLCTWGPDGVTFKASNTISDDAAAAVQEVTSVTHTTRRHVGMEIIEDSKISLRIKLHQKVPALAHLHDVFRRGLKPLDMDGVLQTVLLLAEQYMLGENYAHFRRDLQTALGAEVAGAPGRTGAPFVAGTADAD